MKIAIVGTGYVGLVTGTCFAVATEQLLLSDKDGHAVSFKDAVYYE